MPYGLAPSIIEKLSRVFDHYQEIEEVILYGSRAKGNFSEGSDIDLTIKGKDIDPSIIQKLTIEIDDLMLPWLVDINLFEHINSEALTDHINRVGISIYTRK